MGQNGKVHSFLGKGFPGQEAGEALQNADFVGLRDDADSRRVLFKAYAGVTGGGKTQCAAIGVVAMDAPKGYDALAAIPEGWRIMLPYPLEGDLEGGRAGDKVYLSNTVTGAIQLVAPDAAGELVQEVGTLYWEGSRVTGTNPDEDANSLRVSVKPASVVPGP